MIISVYFLCHASSVFKKNISLFSLPSLSPLTDIPDLALPPPFSPLFPLSSFLPLSPHFYIPSDSISDVPMTNLKSMEKGHLNCSIGPDRPSLPPEQNGCH